MHPLPKFLDLTRGLLIIVVATFVSWFCTGHGLGALSLYYFPVQTHRFAASVSQAESFQWIESARGIPSNVKWLIFNIHNILVFDVLPTAIFVIICFWVLRYYRIPKSTVGLVLPPDGKSFWKFLKIGLASGVVVVALAGVVLTIAVRFGIHYKIVSFDFSKIRFIGLFPGPITEELCFRGVFFAVFERWFPTRVVLFLSAVFFGICHLTGYTLFYSCLVGFMGFFFGWLYVQTRSLLFPILAHTISNFIHDFFVYWI